MVDLLSNGLSDSVMFRLGRVLSEHDVEMNFKHALMAQGLMDVGAEVFFESIPESLSIVQFDLLIRRELLRGLNFSRSILIRVVVFELAGSMAVISTGSTILRGKLQLFQLCRAILGEELQQLNPAFSRTDGATSRSQVYDVLTAIPKPAPNLNFRRSSACAKRIARESCCVKQINGFLDHSLWILAVSRVFSSFIGVRNLVVGVGIWDGRVVEGSEQTGIRLLGISMDPSKTVECMGKLVASALEAVPVWMNLDSMKAFGWDDFSDYVLISIEFPKPVRDYDNLATVGWVVSGDSAATPLKLQIAPNPAGGVRLECRYFDDEFQSTFIERLIDASCEMYCNLTASLSSPIASVGPLTSVWDAAREILPPESSKEERLEVIFSQLASSSKDRVAIWHDEAYITYGQLDDFSNDVAAALLEHGVINGDRIGLFLSESIEAVIAIFGVLKAGAAYVPFDVRYPELRIRTICEVARLRAIVTMEGASPFDLRIPVWSYSTLRNPTRRRLTKALSGLAASDPAYIIFTSGSTGTPKGVEVRHENVSALIRAAGGELSIGESDVWTLFHSLAFDFSVWELFGSLLSGGTLVIVPYFIARSPEDFFALVAKRQVTILSQTPTAFSLFIEFKERLEEVRPLRAVVLGGEPLNSRCLVRWLDRAGRQGCIVVNMYGITETTVHVTAKVVSREVAMSGSKSVGLPISDWHVFVLDSDLMVLPRGVVGDIYVGGAGVANGYVDRADLTRDRFLRVSGSEITLYRTGDVGRLDCRGELEHLGRSDDQVQVRGFRVELNEVKRVILQFPGILAAEVVARQGPSSEHSVERIECFVVAPGTQYSALLGYVATNLPDFMVPAKITIVGSMPLNASGKVDVDRLFAGNVSSTQSGLEQTLPLAELSDGSNACSERRGLEGIFLEVVEEELGLRANWDDNFFKLGGNSLSVIRIVGVLKLRTGVEFSIVPFYMGKSLRNILEIASIGRA
jgi:amino acid adenylation domain-containing protein